MSTEREPQMDEDLLRLLVSEYMEMPALRLTESQAQRLLGIEAAHCRALLSALVDARFLRCLSDGHYARTTEGPLPQSALRRTMAAARGTAPRKRPPAA